MQDWPSAHRPLCGARRHPGCAAALRRERCRQDPHRRSGIDDWHSESCEAPSHMQSHKLRDVWRDITALLPACGKINLRNLRKGHRAWALRGNEGQTGPEARLPHVLNISADGVGRRVYHVMRHRPAPRQLSGGDGHCRACALTNWVRCGVLKSMRRRRCRTAWLHRKAAGWRIQTGWGR